MTVHYDYKLVIEGKKDKKKRKKTGQGNAQSAISDIQNNALNGSDICMVLY